MTNKEFVENVRGAAAGDEACLDLLDSEDLAYIEALARLAASHSDETISSTLETIWPESERSHNL